MGDFVKKIFTLITASAFALIINLNTALIAAEKSMSAGVIYNSTSFEATGNQTDLLQHGTQVINKSVSNDENYPSIFLEYNVVGESGFGMSYGFELVPGTTTFASESRTDVNAASDDDDDAGVYRGEASIKNPKSLYIEPTFMFTEGLGMFLKTGVSHVTFQDGGSKGNRKSDYGEKNVLGGMYGLGAKYNHSSGFFVKAEGVMTKWQAFKVTPAPLAGNLQESIEVNPEQKSIRLAIGMAF